MKTPRQNSQKKDLDKGNPWTVPILVALIGAAATIIVALINN